MTVPRHINPGSRPLSGKNPNYTKTLQIQYLGVSGFVIRRGDEIVMTAPHYTNPGFVRTGVMPIWADHSRIDRLHPRLPAGSVSSILVGHAHYDHLMDVPRVALRHHPRAQIFGSATARNLLLSVKPPVPGARITALNKSMASIKLKRPGKWHEVVPGRVRIMGIESNHSPHGMGVSFYKGKLKEKRNSPPNWVWQWKEGQTLNYLIDFLNDDKTVAYRVFFQDAASEKPSGLWPGYQEDLRKKPIDVAILCVGAYNESKNYPEYILKELKPEHVILSHWESFFRSPMKKPHDVINVRNVLRGGTTDRFYATVRKYIKDKRKIIIPESGSHYLIKQK